MTEGVRRANRGNRSTEGGADDAQTSDGSARLVCEAAFEADAAGQLDRALAGRAERSVLAVLYRHDVRAWTTALRDRCDRIESAAAVAVGPTFGAGPGGDDAAVRTVSDPTDLTGVGIAVGEWVRARDADERPIVCLDSLSALLQYADRERAFRFLHALAAQIRSAGATAYVSVDPGAHDEATLGTFRTLFDTVVRTDRRPGDAATDAEEPSIQSGERSAVTDGGGPDSGRATSGPK